MIGLLGRILVDFVILTRDQKVPWASGNVFGEDAETGFYVSCKNECVVETVVEDGVSYPRMQFCDCVAKLLVEDLTTDFATVSSLTFALGDVRTVEAPSLFASDDGHQVLQTLTYDPPRGTERAPGRVTVWVAQQLGSGKGMHLEGSTYLSQLLAHDEPGAGVLLLSSVARIGRRLSHEVGHVVGFHHTAGEPGLTYVHDVCEAVEWPVLARPTCELNIMGGWYDGPFCCPGLTEPHSGHGTCRERDDTFAEQAYCCGDLCEHRCPAERPSMTFATAEHKDVLRRIADCWGSLVDKPLRTSHGQYVQSLLYTEDAVPSPPVVRAAPGVAGRGFLRRAP